MIHSVTVTNHLGESLELILTQPELSGLIVKDIDGMGPADAAVNITELATVDGGIVNSTRLADKEIKIDLIFLEKPTIEDARLLTYQYFPIKRPITLTFKTVRPNQPDRVARIFGIVERNEPKVFSKQEACSITVKCADPYFHSLEQSSSKFFGTEPLFEFTYSNEVDPNAEKEYLTVDTYNLDGISMTDAINYVQVGQPVETPPMSGLNPIVYDYDFTNVDKVDMVLTSYDSRYSPARTMKELYHGYVTNVVDDPDKKAIILADGEEKDAFRKFDFEYGKKLIILYANRVGAEFNIHLRISSFITSLNSYGVYILKLTGYNANGRMAEKVIYYDPLKETADTYSDIGPNEEITVTYRCSSLKIDCQMNLRPLYSKTLTIVSSDPDSSVMKIADGATNVEVYNENPFGRVLVSRDGDDLTLKVVGGPSDISRSVSIMPYNAYARYKDIYHTEFGNISSITEGNIWYDGDSETGLTLDIIFHGEASDIVIYDKETGEMMAIDDEKLHSIVGPTIYNDILRINTNIGQKSVKYIRGSQTFDILNVLKPPLQWFKLTHGDNIFGYDATTGLENLVFDVKYDILYGGI